MRVTTVCLAAACMLALSATAYSQAILSSTVGPIRSISVFAIWAISNRSWRSGRQRRRLHRYRVFGSIDWR